MKLILKNFDLNFIDMCRKAVNTYLKGDWD